jgi:hypothetical protein
LAFWIVGAVLISVVASVVGVLVASSQPLVTQSGGAVLLLGWWVLSVRVFRGPGEQVDLPRAWWRLTARPVGSFVMAAVFVLGGSSVLHAPHGSFGYSPAFAVTWTSISWVIALAYVHSGLRLTVRGRRSP